MKNLILCNKDYIVNKINDLMLYQIASQHNSSNYYCSDSLKTALEKFIIDFKLDNYKVGDVTYKSGITIKGIVKRK